MTRINDLPDYFQKQVKSIIVSEFGVCNLDNNDNFYGTSFSKTDQFGMKYGYVVIEKHQIWICDCTPDDGDVVVCEIDY